MAVVLRISKPLAPNTVISTGVIGPATPAATAAVAPGADMQRPPRIVAIGGGTGLPVVLRGMVDALQRTIAPRDLSRFPDALTAIVTVTDDGGSSGRLRKELGVLPPGDIRNCLAALSSSAAFERLLQHRFDAQTDLGGHAVGNLMLAALAQMTGNFAAAVDELGRLLRARGRVYPSTVEDVTLRARLHSGAEVEGETAIAADPDRICRLTLARPVRPVPEALRALVNADAIVVGPGSLYTSVLPNLLVDGVASTMSAVRAVRIYVANLMTQPGETDDMCLEDHMQVLREHTGRSIFDYVLVNGTPLTPLQQARYEGESVPVRACPDMPTIDGAQVVVADLLDTSGEQVRHDRDRLAAAVLAIVRHARTAVPSSTIEGVSGQA